jgi:hypothetical protein
MITHTQKKTNKKSNKQKTQRNQWGEMSKQTRNKQTNTPGLGSIKFQS